MTRAPAPAAALAALALAGCGGGGEEGPAPAELVPSSALIYGEAVLRPEGEARTAIETPLAALLDTEDPGAAIVEELDRRIAEGGSDVTWADDIEPWLGERGAIFFSGLYGDGSGEDEAAGAPSPYDCLAPPDMSAGAEPAPEGGADGCALPGDVEDGGFGGGEEGAFLLESTDADAAMAFAEKLASSEGEGVEEATYEGVEFFRTEEGDAAGVVGDAVAFGTEAGFEQVVDTEAGGESLAGDDGFEAALGADGDAAARLYADVPGIVAAAEEAGELGESDRRALDTLLAGAAEEPVAAVVEARTTGFALEYSYGAIEVPFLAAPEAESALLRELPGDAWIAAALPGAGEAIGSILERAGELGIPAGELEGAEAALRRETGLELEDLPESLGDAAAFANGSGIFGTGGGIVVETDDEASGARLVAGLQRAAARAGERTRRLEGEEGEGFALTVPGVPAEVNVVAGADRVVVAYGEEATAAALDPATAENTLGESEDFAAAAEELGEDYAVGGYLDFAPIVDLLDTLALASPDPSLDAALPYLEALDHFVYGARSDGERDHQRFFLGVADVVADPSA